MRSEDDYKLDKAHYIKPEREEETKDDETSEVLEERLQKALNSLYSWVK